MKKIHIIPKGWKNIKLKKLITQDIKNGYSPNCPKEPNGSWVLGLGNLTENGFDPSQAKPAPKEDNRVRDFLLEPGDFLISRSNTLDKVGRTMLFRGEIEDCSYPDLLMRFRVDETRVLNTFFESYLRSSIVRKYIQSCASGTSNTMVKINKTVVEKIPVVLPPYPEQSALADLLSTWDAVIEKTECLIRAKEKRFKWLLRELIFDQQNDIEKHGWKKVRFSEVFKQHHMKNVLDASLDVLSVTTKGIVFQSDYFNKEIASDDRTNYLIVERGMFVLSGLNFWMGAVDFQTICDAGIVSPAYKVFKVRGKISLPEYLCHYVKTQNMMRILHRSSVQGASIVRRNLDLNALNNSFICLPPLEEQQEISSKLSMAHQEIDLLKQLAEKYKIQKRGLMQKMLIGEWRIKSEIINQNMGA